MVSLDDMAEAVSPACRAEACRKLKLPPWAEFIRSGDFEVLVLGLIVTRGRKKDTLGLEVVLGSKEG
jgi:hypothetical protein